MLGVETVKTQKCVIAGRYAPSSTLQKFAGRFSSRTTQFLQEPLLIDDQIRFGLWTCRGFCFMVSESYSDNQGERCHKESNPIFSFRFFLLFGYVSSNWAAEVLRAASKS
jgi:hypothetical protein